MNSLIGSSVGVRRLLPYLNNPLFTPMWVWMHSWRCPSKLPFHIISYISNGPSNIEMPGAISQASRKRAQLTLIPPLFFAICCSPITGTPWLSFGSLILFKTVSSAIFWSKEVKSIWEKKKRSETWKWNARDYLNFEKYFHIMWPKVIFMAC